LLNDARGLDTTSRDYKGGVNVGILAGAAIGGAVNIVDSLESEGGTVVVTVSASKHPEAAEHILDAQEAGYPSVLTLDKGGADANRALSLKGIPKIPGKQLDEYPPAMFKEGGAGAAVRPISPGDNMGAGASMGNQLRGVSNGTKVIIKVVP
jgi:hypothetical protein